LKKALIGILITVVLALACGEEEGITAPTYEYEPITVLGDVETAIDDGDIDLLKSCLDPAFVYYFDARDVGRTPPGSEYEIPESWPYTEFWSAVHNMFNGAYYVGFNVYTNRVGAPGEEAMRYEAGRVRVRLVVMVSEQAGFTAEGGYCDFAFDAYRNPKREKLWRLSEWRDFTSVYGDATPGLQPLSLGMVLAMYR
jgi:hypothetical protein